MRRCRKRPERRSSAWRTATPSSPASAAGRRPTRDGWSAWTASSTSASTASRAIRAYLEYTPQLERLIETADWPWRVETKAGVTAAFHYREVEDDEAAGAVERVVETAEALGLAVQRGRKVIEVKPPIDADKGTAARALLEERGIDRALYAGDDTTDLDAFRGLDEAGWTWPSRSPSGHRR